MSMREWGIEGWKLEVGSWSLVMSWRFQGVKTPLAPRVTHFQLRISNFHVSPKRLPRTATATSLPFRPRLNTRASARAA